MNLFVRFVLGLSVLAALSACTAPGAGSGDAGTDTAAAHRAGAAVPEDSVSLQITSTAFAANGDIPKTHTCDGPDVSPPLSWSGVPEGTKSLALIVDDPDAPDPAAPRVVWVHWVLYDLPADLRALPAATGADSLPQGARPGLNDWKQAGWRGPCPPVGRHRYFFKLYALDTVLPDLGRPDKAALEKAMTGHVLARAELVGHYRKP